MIYIFMGIMFWLGIGVLNYIYSTKSILKRKKERGISDWKPSGEDFTLCLGLGPIMAIIGGVKLMYYYGLGTLNTFSGLNDDILNIHKKTFHVEAAEVNSYPHRYYKSESFTVTYIDLLDHTKVKIVDNEGDYKEIKTSIIMGWLNGKEIKELSHDELTILSIN